VRVTGPVSVRAPQCGLGTVADIAAVSPGKGVPAQFVVPTGPVSQPTATKIATTLQATQNAYNAKTPSTVGATLPPTTCGGTGGGAVPAIAKVRASAAPGTSGTAAATPPIETFFGPKVSQVLAATYASHPTRADVEAFLEELGLAASTPYTPARTFARLSLVEAFDLGRATLAYQLGDKRLSQLDLAKITLGSMRARGRKASKRLLTITPSALGGRVLRMLEVAGLSHRVTITLTESVRTKGHTTRTTRTIRVI